MYKIRGMERSDAIPGPLPNLREGKKLGTPLIFISVSLLCLSVFTHCIFIYSLCISLSLVLVFSLFNLSDFCNLISFMWIYVSLHASLCMCVFPPVLSLSLLPVFSVFHVPKSQGVFKCSCVYIWLPYIVCSQVPNQGFYTANCWWVTLGLSLGFLSGQAWCSQLLCCPDPSQTDK